MAPPEPVPMRSMRVMTSDIRYTGVTYAPFTAALPSEQSTASESSSGRPTGSIRRGKILGPDTRPADESPIGEPWILAIFAILFAGVIIRKNNSTMKNIPSIQSVQNKLKVSTKSVVNATKVLSPILLFAFLTLGFGQVWGWTFNRPYLYYNNSDGWSKVMMLMYYKNGNGDSDKATQGFTFNQISNTNLWFCKADENRGTSLSGYTWGLADANGGDYPWKKESEEGWDARWGWLTSHCNSHYAGASQTDLGYNTYYITSSGHTLTITKKADEGNWPENTLPEYSAYLKIKKSEDGGSSYPTTITSGTWPGSFTLQGTKIKRNGDKDSGSTPYGKRDGDCTGPTTTSGSQATYDKNIVTGLVTMTHNSTTDDAYEFAGWGTGNSPSSTGNTKEYHITANTTYYAFFKRKQFTVTFAPKGTYGTSTVTAEISSTAISSGSKQNYGSSISFTATPAAGYKLFSPQAWYSDDACSSSLGNGTSTTYNIASLTSAKSVYVKFVPKQCSITLDYQISAEGYSSSGDITNASSLTATYDATMTPLTGTMPTAAQGYKFMGFYTGTNGTGTKYYNADGSSANNWAIDTEDPTTLYAYYEVAKVSLSFNHDAFEPLDAASGDDDKDYVIATPTVSPVPEGNVTICWDLLYENDNPVPDHPVVDAGGNAKKFSIVGLRSGTYKVRATLRAGSGCSGTILHICDKSFSIASDHSTTIVYKCGSEEIHSPTTVSAKPLEWSSAITPEEIFGYSFSSWTAGDGITISTDGSSAIDGSTTTTSTIYIKAYYSGTLTANYTKKKMIFFKNTLGWSNPYVYFYKDGGYWGDGKGAGCNGDACLNKNYARRMDRIDGTDIWYFDYGGTGFVNQVTKYVAFTDGDKSSHENFNGVDVVYATSYTCGFSSGTPMFVPLPKGAGGQSSDEVNGAHYYSKGYWTNYLGEGTGYTLKVYSSSGSLIKDVKFTSEDKLMSMKATTDLEAGTDYKFYVDRADGFSHGNDGSITYSNENTAQIMNKNSSNKRTIRTAASGDYVFTLTYSGSELYISVDYPSTVNDYRLVYKDLASSSYWSKGTAHTAAWSHPSRVISKAAGAEDIVSFFVVKGANATLQFQHITSITAGTGAISWDNDGSAINIDDTYNLETGVYNFYLKQSNPAGTITIDKVEPYTGEFYIRTDAANNKWDNYRAADHRMTYSSFSESDENSFGEKYSHYYMHWCPYNTNVKFVIANDYSPCISDTLIKDNTFLNNMNDAGFLLDDEGRPDINNKYSANIRFMWNRKTNKISRAYIASSTNKDRKFLVLRAAQTIWDEDSKPVSEGFTNGVILEDKQNWMYETTISITPSTKFKLFACYAEATPSESGAQYFRGHYASDSWTDENTVVLIGGSGSTQKARVIYDFKTNRLMAAWIPSGSAVSGTVEINADVLVEREHQEAAQYITFADASSKLSKVKTVYGAMKFNRWILNNRQHPEDENPDHGKTDDQLSTYHPPLTSAQKSIYERSLYFISFPFDVKVSDIFGFGHYWDEWYLEYYDGKTRAKNGYWIDSPPNWKYVTPEMADTMVLRKYVGYILGLDLDYMQANNYNFWTNGISTIELFFPSTTNQETLQQTTVTIPALSEDYKCTINRGTTEGDRRVKDSYWRCIGTPSFNLYNTAVSDGSGNITWKTDYTWKADESEFPFIYMWNKADNTLTAQATSTFTFLPMHAYLVQNGKQIVWTNVSARPSSIVARQESAIMPNEYNWRITLSRDSVTEDQTYVRMTSLEQVTDSFDFGQDLVKELNTGRSDIYTFIGYERVAANSRPIETTQTTIVPMGLNIETTGEYTFSIPEGTDGVGVVLVDEATGIRTSLSALDYTVTLQQGDYTNRFYLEISPIQNTPTGIDEVPSDQVPSTKVRKVMIDGVLYIVRDGKIFDARGARVE